MIDFLGPDVDAEDAADNIDADEAMVLLLVKLPFFTIS